MPSNVHRLIRNVRKMAEKDVRLSKLERLLVLARDFRDQMVEQGHARRSLPAEYDTLSDAIDALEPPPCAST